MHKLMKAVCLSVILVLATASAWANGASGSEESVVIVYADGHRQNLDLAQIASIELKNPVTIVFKDGRKQSLSAADGARIEFETSSVAPVPGRYHFVGKWEVGEGNGSNFYIRLNEDAEAHKTLGASHGTWTVVNGEARISWDDGWHDAIKKVGTKHEKLAFEPGKSFDDPPSNVTAARNTEPKPI